MKKTLMVNLLDLIAPNYCYFCGKLAEGWCEECRKSFTPSPIVLTPQGDIVTKEIYLSDRDGVYKQIVDDYKFNQRKHNYLLLEELLCLSVAELLSDSKYCVIPLPTSSKHIRARGFDHTELIAKRLARNLNLEYNDKILLRAKNTMQRGETAQKRHKQAQEAYKIGSRPSKGKIYILLDDIKTTGASLQAAAELLRANGATEIWLVYILRQK